MLCCLRALNVRIDGTSDVHTPIWSRLILCKIRWVLPLFYFSTRKSWRRTSARLLKTSIATFYSSNCWIFISWVANFWGSTHIKHSRSCADSVSETHPRRSPLHNGQNNFRGTFAPTFSQLDDVSGFRRVNHVREENAINLDINYASKGYRLNIPVTKFTRSPDIARDCSLKNGGFDCDNLHFLD